MKFTKPIPFIVGIVCLQIPNLGIGWAGRLLFKCIEDMMFFTKTTLQGKNPCVLFGRKSWFAIHQKFRPLKGRTNIIVSRDWLEIMAEFPGVYAFPSPQKALAWAKEHHDMIYICGGGEVYKTLLHECSILYVTEIKGAQESDTFFPSFRNRFNLSKQIQEGFCDDKETPYVINMYTKQFGGEGAE